MDNIDISNMTMNDLIESVIKVKEFEEKKRKRTEGNTRRQMKYIENNREKYTKFRKLFYI